MSIEDLTGTIVRKICMACSREFAGSGGTCPHDGNMLVALPSDPYVGRRIADKYHVLSVLGTGGMGVVYLARHETMQSNVAIKMLRAQFVGDSASVKRFTQEAIATRRLSHPNVINTYDHGFTPQGQPYIVMEVLEGKSLADEIKRLKQISVERVIHIFSQACDAIDHAHKQGIIHRDLKPGNIMLINSNDDPDFVKVVDFGVAKFMPSPNGAGADIQTLTQAGEICGSPVYMSPEQCLGQDLDRRADVYSMGIVIYEALTGRLPLIGKNMVETMSKHINDAPPPFKDVRPDLYIPEKVEQAVMRALAKRPDGRQPNMAMLKQDLSFAVPRPGQNPNLRSIAISSSGMSEETSDKKPSWLLPVIAAAVSAIVVAGAAIFFLGQKPPPAVQKAVTPAPIESKTTVPATTTTGQPASTVTSTSPLNSNPTTAKPVQPPQNQASQTMVHETDSTPKPVSKPAALKKQQTKIAATPKPHHTQAAAAVKPHAAASSSDPFAALSKERTYKVNN